MPDTHLLDQWRRIGATLGGQRPADLLAPAEDALDRMIRAAGLSVPPVDSPDPQARLAVRLRKATEELQRISGPAAAVAFVQQWQGQLTGR